MEAAFWMFIFQDSSLKVPSPPLKASPGGLCCESRAGGPGVAEPSHSQDPQCLRVATAILLRASPPPLAGSSLFLSSKPQIFKSAENWPSSWTRYSLVWPRILKSNPYLVSDVLCLTGAQASSASWSRFKGSRSLESGQDYSSEELIMT